ncbi:MAG: glycosyltransferase family 2 protein [Saprospiraceae bacterium]|nr:glycosyltransferase family 2 protein [Saprospiraceae bacterium]
MNDKAIIDVIIPAFNEADSIAKVIGDIPKEIVREIIVCDNNSTDNTGQVATNAGAKVLLATKKGYGSACLKGLDYLAQQSTPPDIVVFIDGDYSDYPEQLPLLIEPIQSEQVDLVIGSRALGKLEKGSMTPQQVFGNWLATSLIKRIYGYHFTDLGPFRAVRYKSLLKINMQDPDFGWTVEMQVKAAKLGMNCKEIAVNYRQRIGVSKISGTIKGTILAGHKILWTIFKLI